MIQLNKCFILNFNVMPVIKPGKPKNGLTTYEVSLAPGESITIIEPEKGDKDE